LMTSNVPLTDTVDLGRGLAAASLPGLAKQSGVRLMDDERHIEEAAGF